ncbi:MAG: ArgP/LysG family DNA-binding transcriptional regulator [Simkaniaceae bacterium]|nr:ArgP/LysG family DNA-binding transcriptional regulator [Simkaniaceae bacterium]
MHIDYKGIEALYEVQELGSFEEAAKRLKISQSAVSQRVKSLEGAHGEALLVREPPYQPTPKGALLIAYYKKILLLERDLVEAIEGVGQEAVISIALNRDSLETWFLGLMDDPCFKQVRLEIFADDQERTLDYFRRGLVSACLTTTGKPFAGEIVESLGSMPYVLAASPEFYHTYFSAKPNWSAPAIKFDQNDYLHERYLEKYFDVQPGEIPFHQVPSVAGFKKYTLLGYGYALIPLIDIAQELERGELVEIFPNKRWDVELFWRYWSVHSPSYQKFNERIVALARQAL